MDRRDSEVPRTVISDEQNRISGAIVQAALTVHRQLGPGLLENVYETCLAYELQESGYDVQRQVHVPIYYGDLEIEMGYRLDLLVNNLVVVELKAVEQLLPVHQAQLLTYLKLSHHHLGLLINFNVPRIKDGIKRLII